MISVRGEITNECIQRTVRIVYNTIIVLFLSTSLSDWTVAIKKIIRKIREGESGSLVK